MTSEIAYVFKVDIPCSGCEKTIRRVIEKNFGRELIDIDIDIPTQIVKIKLNSPHTYEYVYSVLAKCGRTVSNI
jgi:copper chaperone CopZ